MENFGGFVANSCSIDYSRVCSHRAGLIRKYGVRETPFENQSFAHIEMLEVLDRDSCG